jgi:hypothetical protein
MNQQSKAQLSPVLFNTATNASSENCYRSERRHVQYSGNSLDVHADNSPCTSTRQPSPTIDCSGAPVLLNTATHASSQNCIGSEKRHTEYSSDSLDVHADISQCPSMAQASPTINSSSGSRGGARAHAAATVVRGARSVSSDTDSDDESLTTERDVHELTSDQTSVELETAKVTYVASCARFLCSTCQTVLTKGCVLTHMKQQHRYTSWMTEEKKTLKRFVRAHTGKLSPDLLASLRASVETGSAHTALAGITLYNGVRCLDPVCSFVARDISTTKRAHRKQHTKCAFESVKVQALTGIETARKLSVFVVCDAADNCSSSNGESDSDDDSASSTSEQSEYMFEGEDCDEQVAAQTIETHDSRTQSVITGRFGPMLTNLDTVLPIRQRALLSRIATSGDLEASKFVLCFRMIEGKRTENLCTYSAYIA